jgi:hypothetical protein
MKTMKKSFSIRQRALVVFVCFAAAIAGFMIKLPPGFRHMDKELHAAFYFLAAAFLNILFAGTSFIRHVIIFVLLCLFGAAIEHGQAYSNRFFRSRIHGNYDPADMQANVNGLLAFSLLWLVCTAVIVLNRKSLPKEKKYNSSPSR